MAYKRIIVCDDNPDILELIKLCFEQEDRTEVISLTSGREVLDHLSITGVLPDLLILDLMLPDLEGDDLIKLLRSKPEFEGIPTILMSGIIENVCDRARLVGADDYLAKPFSVLELKEKVRALLNSKN